ncbi:valine--tRNA ligase [Patescibacteria group bacterium]|nr:valine--tRNA ligase [Patescibacteria group bacterium]
MEKIYEPQKTEAEIYEFWEKEGWFTPRIPSGQASKKKPFTILLPLPNANDPIHMGHALFAVEDIIIRYHRMLGEPTLWLPGADHAGIETQFVFEKELAKKGKSRFDFDRQTLYQMIVNFVEKNKNINRDQLKRMGFSLDWTRYHYSLEPEIVEKVLATFRQLHQDGLIYRGERIVNFCTHCGTAFSDLEVEYEERKDPLYYMKYGPFVLATTRPETKFGDTAVAVNPKDKRYQKWIGKEFIYQSLIGPRKMKVVADKVVDPDFGTGAVKVTPAHDPDDFEIAQRHNLAIIKVINLDGKLNQLAGRFAGLTVAEARKKVAAELQKKGDLVKIDNDYLHRVGFCYRCGTTIEPMVIPQWFVKIKPLAQPALEAVKKGKTTIVPKKRFEKMYLDWLENIRDWNISRQIVWGPRIPVWYCLDCNQDLLINFINKKGEKISGTYQEFKNKYHLAEISAGLQSLMAGKNPVYALDNQPCKNCGGKNVLQETDTFDTWFLSGQWPLTTLGYPDSPDFKYFYPTSVLDTLWDILFFWVARMMMFGLYLTKEVPFKVVHIHCRAVDKKGKKISKSKGNVINPIEMVEKYSADALRIALVFGAAPGSDICVSEDKIRAMRNFANKIWNASRFILSYKENRKNIICVSHPDDLWIIEETNKIVKQTTRHLDRYRFDLAAEEVYQFFWHTFCDQYLEMSKKRRDEAQQTLIQVLATSLKLLHPFMPFITEQVWQLAKTKSKGKKTNFFKEEALIIAQWPKTLKTN